MEIYINDEVLNGKPDKERNIAEIFDEMNKWAESQGKYLVNCLVDGKEIDKTRMEKIQVDGAKRLDFFIGEELDMLQSSLYELDQYVDKIGNTILGRDSLTETEHNDLIEGSNWIQTVLNSAQKLLRIDYSKIKPLGKGKTVDSIIGYLVNFSGKLDSVSAIEEYLENLRDLKLFIIDLINRTSALDMSQETLFEIINTFSSGMDSLKEEFIKVNENYQSGKDIIANELLTHAVGRLNILLTGLISLGNKEPGFDVNSMRVGEVLFSEINNALNDILARAAKALEENDIVQAGDILEYELPDSLDSLVPFLNEIKEKIKGTKDSG